MPSGPVSSPMNSHCLTSDNACHLKHLRQLGELPALRDYHGQRPGFSPDARFAFSVTMGHMNALRWWELSEGTPRPRFHHSLYGVWAAVATPEGNRLLSLTVQGTLQEWSLTEGGLLREATVRRATTSLSRSPRGDLLLLTDCDGGSLLWDVPEWRPRRKLKSVPVRLRCSAVAMDGSLAIAGGAANSIYFWDTTTGAVLESVPVQAERVRDVSVHPSGELLAVGTSSEHICLIDLKKRQVVRLLKGPASGTWGLSFSPDGELLTASYGPGFDVFRVHDGAYLFGNYDPNDQQMSTAVFSPDGKFIAWGRGDGTVGLWGVDE